MTTTVAIGDIVKLDHKPTNVGGHGFHMLRYRLERYLDLPLAAADVFAWVYGPLVFDGEDWLPDPTRRVRHYLVPRDSIEVAP